MTTPYSTARRRTPVFMIAFGAVLAALSATKLLAGSTATDHTTIDNDTGHDTARDIDHRDLARQDWQPLTASHRTTNIATTAADYCGGFYRNPVNPNNLAATKRDLTLPVEASAGHTAMDDGVASFSQQVLMTQGPLSLRAEQARYDANTATVELREQVVVRTPDAAFGGASARFNLRDHHSRIDAANYILHHQHIRGSADTIVADPQQINIDNGSYTRCAPDSQRWQLHAQQIQLDPQRGQGRAKHAHIRLHGLPVAYLPYLRFPIGEARQSGLLFPSIADGDNGLDIALPYYFNIASNFDATVTPRYRQQRGYSNEAQLRWLNRFDHWQINANHLDNDRVLAAENPSANPSRWLIHASERSHIGQRWVSHIDYSRASDRQYFRDLGNSFSTDRRHHLDQRASLKFLGDRWQAGAEIHHRQQLAGSDESHQPYATSPELWLDYRSASRPFRPSAKLSWRHSHFSHDNLSAINSHPVVSANGGKRHYGELQLSYPMRWRGLQLLPQIGAQHLRYALDDGSTPRLSARQASLRGNLSLQSQQHNHTLEPGFFYLYRNADEDESGAQPNFDTAALSDGRDQLFTGQRYSGYDLLENNRQLSLYLRHRRFDTSGRQRLAASLGQVFYFQDTAAATAIATNGIGNSNTAETQRRSALVGTLDWRWQDRWQGLSSAHWDSENNRVEAADFSLRYRSQRHIANLDYHYRREDSHRQILQQTIEHANISLSTPLSRHWRLLGRYQYDIPAQRGNEALAGLEYNDCCSKWRLIYRDSLTHDDDSSDPLAEHRDRSVLLQFELKGLFAVGKAIDNVLDKSILGHRTMAR